MSSTWSRGMLSSSATSEKRHFALGQHHVQELLLLLDLRILGFLLLALGQQVDAAAAERQHEDDADDEQAQDRAA